MKVQNMNVMQSNGLRFKAGHSNPHQAPVPLGRSYSEFPNATANDSRPRDQVADKVDASKVMHSSSSANTQKNA